MRETRDQSWCCLATGQWSVAWSLGQDGHTLTLSHDGQRKLKLTVRDGSTNTFCRAKEDGAMATGSQNEKKRRKDFSQRTTDDIEATATTDFRPSVTNDMALPFHSFAISPTRDKTIRQTCFAITHMDCNNNRRRREKQPLTLRHKSYLSFSRSRSVSLHHSIWIVQCATLAMTGNNAQHQHCTWYR